MLNTFAGANAREDHVLFAAKIGRDQGQHRASDYLVFDIAEDPLGSGVPARYDAFECFAYDTVIRGRDDGRKPSRHKIVNVYVCRMRAFAGPRIVLVVWHIPL